MIVFLSAVFALQLRLAPDIGAKNMMSVESLIALGPSSYEMSIGQGQLWRIFLSPLLHADTSHLVGNCVAMFFVGVRLEPWAGRGWYAAIFALSGLGGEIGSLIGSDPHIPGVGASGAISGLVGALFAMSFCKRDLPGFETGMRKTALVFGVPALAPLLWGGGGNVNYYAHLGGAIVGCALGFVVGLALARRSEAPILSKAAAWLAAAGLLLSSGSAAMAATHYDQQVAHAREMAPLKALPADIKDLSPQVFEKLAAYPNDPRAHLLRGLYHLAKTNKVLEGEAELRAAIRQAETAGGYLLPVAGRAKAPLALVLQYKGQNADAKAAARDQCGAKDPMIRGVLTKAKLCG